jgi:ribosome-binding protein aMBF1 (putative translation factor)
MIIGMQCWVARSALGWSVLRLARAVKVSSHTVVRFERGEAVGPIIVQKIQDTLEKAGVIFIDSNDGGPGARLRRPQTVAI